MQVILYKIRKMDMVSIYMKMAPCMKVNGKMIYFMGKENVSMEMVDTMKDNGKMERNVEWEKFLMLMEQGLKDPSKMINIMDSEYKSIQMVLYLLENGN